MEQADILIVNARALTLDGRGTRCDTLAIAGNEIIFTGDAQSAKALRHKGTRVINAERATVLPGFIESHMHIFSGAAELDQLHLTGVKGFAALAEKVRTYAAARPELKLIVAQSADYTILSKQARVSRHHLDRIVAGRS